MSSKEVQNKGRIVEATGFFGAIDYWNRHYPEIQIEHAGKYVTILPSKPSQDSPSAFRVLSGDPEELERVAKEKGHEFPFIQLVPTGKEREEIGIEGTRRSS